jgi:hypothetical protein
MTFRCFRIQPADRDPAALLDPATWKSRVWVGTVYRTCPGCRGEGEVVGDPRPCVSCTDDVDMCDACRGLGFVSDVDVCPTCQGVGEVDDSVRRGVSACRTIDDLYRYFAEREADIADCVVVEMEADIADEEDWDHQRGAILVYPRRIISVTPLDPQLVEAAC